MGNILQLDSMPFRSYGKWADKYGPICRVDLANTRYVTVFHTSYPKCFILGQIEKMVAHAFNYLSVGKENVVKIEHFWNLLNFKIFTYS